VRPAVYVIELLAEILGEQPLREQRFPWWLGDPSPKTGRRIAQARPGSRPSRRGGPGLLAA